MTHIPWLTERDINPKLNSYSYNYKPAEGQIPNLNFRERRMLFEKSLFAFERGCFFKSICLSLRMALQCKAYTDDGRRTAIIKSHLDFTLKSFLDF